MGAAQRQSHRSVQRDERQDQLPKGTVVSFSPEPATA
jgi:hypothetical protein